jgi:hypothetical protein
MSLLSNEENNECINCNNLIFIEEYNYCPYCGISNGKIDQKIELEFDENKYFNFFKKILNFFYLDDVHEFLNRLFILILLLIIQSLSGLISLIK